MTNEYGNYVIQYILGLQITKTNREIAIKFLDHLEVLCKEKFSSNVVEKVIRLIIFLKCLENSPEETRELIIKTIINKEGFVKDLLTHPYGNYGKHSNNSFY